VPPEVRAGQPVTTAADLWPRGHLGLLGSHLSSKMYVELETATVC